MGRALGSALLPLVLQLPVPAEHEPGLSPNRGCPRARPGLSRAAPAGAARSPRSEAPGLFKKKIKNHKLKKKKKIRF